MFHRKHKPAKESISLNGGNGITKYWIHIIVIVTTNRERRSCMENGIGNGTERRNDCIKESQPLQKATKNS